MAYLMLQANSVGPNNQPLQSNMDENTETIPWLVYQGIGLVGEDDEARHEADAADDERRENEEWWGGAGEEYEADNHGRTRLAHIIRVYIADSVTAIPARAFMYCTELKDIRIPPTIASIGSNAFAFCESLGAIQLPGSLRSIQWNAFTVCALTSIWLPDSVVSIGYLAFSRCVFLQSIRLPGGITRIELDAFTGCTALATVNVPGLVVSIEHHAFSHCQSLRAITISVSSNLSDIGRAAFAGCPMLTEIDVGRMAVALWPRLLQQLGSQTGLFGCHTGLDNRQRKSFVLSFLWKHMMQFFEGGGTVPGRSTKRRPLATQN
jgi:hypothetical protein